MRAQDSFIYGADYLNKVGREVLEDDRLQPIRSRGFLPNEARKGLPHQVRSDDVRVASLDMINIEMGMDVMWEGGRLGSGEVGVHKEGRRLHSGECSRSISPSKDRNPRAGLPLQ